VDARPLTVLTGDHDGVQVTYPEPPWRLAGRLLIAVAPLGADAAHAVVPAPLRAAPARLAVLVFGLYGEKSTLRYGELAGVVGPVLAGGLPGGVVTSIWVDDERSVAGGRELWGVPKELATLRWRPGRFEAHDAAGAPIARARWNEPRVHVPMPVAAPFFGCLDGVVRRGFLAGITHVAPARIELEIPGGSPLAALGFGGRHFGLSGRLDVRAFAARRAR
jgi:hypothetical protein